MIKKIGTKILVGALNRSFKKRIKEIENLRLVPRNHYAYTSVDDEFAYNLLTIQQNNLINFTIENTRSLDLESILEVGCTSDLFLKEVETDKKMGLNFLDVCCKQIERQGICPIKANADTIPLPEKSVDVVICYQMLEHSLSPIKVLRELERISRGLILLSIPWVLKTNIRSKDHGVQPDGRPMSEYHIFEFSEEDFRRILSYTNLEIREYKKLLNYRHFQNPLLYNALKLLYLGYFPALQAYVLKSPKVWAGYEY